VAAQEEKIEETLRPLIECLREGLGQNLIALVLFGSRARGEATPESDWDIFLVAESLPSSPLKRYALFGKLVPGNLKGEVSFLAKTRKEFAGGVPSFYLDLALDGVILYDTEGYMQGRLNRIRGIIKEAGLKRERINGGFFWDWEQTPGAEWEISWEGFRK